ncbi:hypothetical protein [Parafrankia soli]|uniref:hypothetical protein n=1 Tax=Parafrankia soli TaxID=2599596 RepID=UPI000ABBF1B1|nr:hypothetical protein [Parafrankia soli]
MTDQDSTDRIVGAARATNIVTSVVGSFAQPTSFVLPDTAARAVWQVHDFVADAGMRSSAAREISSLTRPVAEWSSGARVGEALLFNNPAHIGGSSGIIPLLNFTSAAVTGMVDAAGRGASPLTATMSGAVGGLASVAATPADSVMNAALSTIKAVWPSSTGFADYVSSLTPSTAATGIATSGIERVGALTHGDREALDRNTDQMLAGKFTEVMRGYAVLAYSLRDAQSRTELVHRAETGELGALARVGITAADGIFSWAHEPYEAAPRGYHPTADQPVTVDGQAHQAHQAVTTGSSTGSDVGVGGYSATGGGQFSSADGTQLAPNDPGQAAPPVAGSGFGATSFDGGYTGLDGQAHQAEAGSPAQHPGTTEPGSPINPDSGGGPHRTAQFNESAHTNTASGTNTKHEGEAPGGKFTPTEVSPDGGVVLPGVAGPAGVPIPDAVPHHDLAVANVGKVTPADSVAQHPGEGTAGPASPSLPAGYDFGGPAKFDSTGLGADGSATSPDGPPGGYSAVGGPFYSADGSQFAPNDPSSLVSPGSGSGFGATSTSSDSGYPSEDGGTHGTVQFTGADYTVQQPDGTWTAGHIGGAGFVTQHSGGWTAGPADPSTGSGGGFGHASFDGGAYGPADGGLSAPDAFPSGDAAVGGAEADAAPPPGL